MKIPSTNPSCTVSKLLLCLLLLVSCVYFFYSTSFVYSSSSSFTQTPPIQTSPPSPTHKRSNVVLPDSLPPKPAAPELIPAQEQKTNLSHVVFGIAASANLWNHRKEYIKLWWKPDQMRGFVWLDRTPDNYTENRDPLPPIRISQDTSKFKYTFQNGHRSALRISRIVSETLRLGITNNVRWFVMGDDDTFFVSDNLIRVLQKYDHNQFYYIGSSSESHTQNIRLSYNMAFGGGGFAISYPLAKELEKMQDGCIQRYPSLFGSDDRMQACMAELGVPLTKEPGFHQFDIFGSALGLLAAHPISPLVTLHHLDVIEPLFPDLSRLQALQKLRTSIELDSAAVAQQSICYDVKRSWTVSVSWGYTVQIIRGIFPAREMETPSRTYLNWIRHEDYRSFPFNTRPYSRNKCQRPFVFYMDRVRVDGEERENGTTTVSEYLRYGEMKKLTECTWKKADPEKIDKVEVFKKVDSHMWDKHARRNCCKVLKTNKKETMVVEVGPCREGEFIGV